jgi:hypothetical protein
VLIEDCFSSFVIDLILLNCSYSNQLFKAVFLTIYTERESRTNDGEPEAEIRPFSTGKTDRYRILLIPVFKGKITLGTEIILN